MFPESAISAEALQKAGLEVRGTNPDTTAKIAWLKAKWGNKRYRNKGEETTMMHGILFMDTTPLHTAVLVDNLSYFKANYKFSSENVELFLIEACLCGSRSIAEHLLLVELKSSYKVFPESLAYIAASMNTECAKEIALLLAKEKVPLESVLDVYRLADGPIVDEIVGIFKTEASSKPAPVSSSSTSSSAAMASNSTARATISSSTPLPPLKVSAPPTSTAPPSSSSLVSPTDRPKPAS